MALALPSTYLLQTHLSMEALHDLEDQIPTLTYDITEAKLILGKVTTKQRALFELRSRKLWTEEVLPVEIEVDDVDVGVGGNARPDTPPRKRRKTDDTEAIEVSEVDLRTESEAETDSLTGSPILRPSQQRTQSQDRSSPTAPFMSSPLSTGSFVSAVTSIAPQPDIEWGDTIKVVKLDWFTECLAAGHLLPIRSYLVYEGRPVPPPRTTSAEPQIIKVPPYLLYVILHLPKFFFISYCIKHVHLTLRLS
jgi:DNA polymerase IV